VEVAVGVPQQHCVAVTDASQIGEVRRQASRIAELAGLSDTQRGAVAIAATELATNLSRYATNGQVLVQQLSPIDGTCVEILAIDAGPGMDVDRCLRDGYSTGGTAGNGLGAVKRLADEFDLYSTAGGSVVMARVGRRPRPPAARAFRWGAVSTPAPHEAVCGDAWAVAERDGEIVVMVADGRTVQVFDRSQFVEPAAFCDEAHRALTGTRGAALALAHVSKRGVRFAGVGNIAGSLVAPGGQGRGLLSQNGTAGFQMRAPQQLDYPWPVQGCLVMHSDGLAGRWSMATYPGLLRRHPAVIAGVLYRDSVRGRDDATVVVVGDELVP
jgi:anti-sigma regulatory factor (Ser/Thr protein kinase)